MTLMANFSTSYYFIPLVAVSYFLLEDLKQGSKKELPLNSSSKIEIRMPIYYLLLGLFFIGAAIYFGVLIIQNSNGQKSEIWLELLIFNILVVFTLLIFGVYFLLNYFNHRVVIEGDILEIYHWRGAKTQLKRDEITKFRDSFSMRKFQIQTANKVFKVHQYLVGLATLKIWLTCELIENESV